MNLISLALAAAIIGGAANGQGIPVQNMQERQIEQQRRIRQGVRSGEITPGEARVLGRRQMRLRRRIRRDRAERFLIRRQQNRLSNQIYRLRHR